MGLIRSDIPLAVELREIVLADAALILGFFMVLNGGIAGLAHGGNMSQALLYLPIIAIGVTLSFVLHELMHKFVAQRYGAIAGFRTSTMGLAITVASGMFGFLLGIPGATMIYVHSFTKRQNGLVSLAGPLTNFVIFGASLAILLAANPPLHSYLSQALSFIIFISLFLAFFNMLPIMPLDGSKVLAWSKPVYAAVMGALLFLMLAFAVIPIIYLLYMLGFAILISFLYRNMF
jgi:Zn-dependent protease